MSLKTQKIMAAGAGSYYNDICIPQAEGTDTLDRLTGDSAIADNSAIADTSKPVAKRSTWLEALDNHLEDDKLFPKASLDRGNPIEELTRDPKSYMKRAARAVRRAQLGIS